GGRPPDGTERTRTRPSRRAAGATASTRPVGGREAAMTIDLHPSVGHDLGHCDDLDDADDADDADDLAGASLARTAARSAQLQAETTADPARFRVLTGDRPTGDLHLGHYFGTLANRVALQRRGVETFVVVADYQVVTDRDGVGPIRDRVRSLVTDYLAIGLD